MKRIAIALAALAGVTAGAAGAQGYGAYRPGPYDPGAFWRGAPDNPYQRIQFLQDRVNAGIADGSLDRREAGRVNGELNGMRGWIHRMHWEDAGRLTPSQRAQVQGRLDGISRQIHWLRRNGW
jgi:hypothetical protein